MAPNYPSTLHRDDGRDIGIGDRLVPQQGPNYALAKHLQRWRAAVARATGTLYVDAACADDADAIRHAQSRAGGGVRGRSTIRARGLSSRDRQHVDGDAARPRPVQPSVARNPAVVPCPSGRPADARRCSRGAVADAVCAAFGARLRCCSACHGRSARSTRLPTWRGRRRWWPVDATAHAHVVRELLDTFGFGAEDALGPGAMWRRATSRGTFTSVKDHNAKIRAFITGWKTPGRTFVWTADQILKKPTARRLRRGAASLASASSDVRVHRHNNFASKIRRTSQAYSQIPR